MRMCYAVYNGLTNASRGGGHLPASWMDACALPFESYRHPAVSSPSLLVLSTLQTVTAVPEIRAMRLLQGDEFLILACDGIWDVLTNQQAVDFARERLLKGISPPQICEEMCDRCLAPDTDNCGKVTNDV